MRVFLSRSCALALVAVAVACGAASTTSSDEAKLAFPQGNNLGYCASNPSPECSQGHPVANKQLVLTFDDGPGSQTSALSTWLRGQGIHATFFELGEYVGSGSNPILAQLEADGHLVGNHTWDHADLTTLSSSQVVDEVSSTDALIAPYVDQSHFIFRAPYGAWSANDYTALNGSAMKKYVGPVRWDIGGQMTSLYAADWDCWQNTSGYGVLTTKQCGDRYLRQIADVGRGIVLLHDQDYGDVSNHNLTSGQGNTIDMVKYMVPILKQQGYTFLRADQVPDIAAAFGVAPSDAGAPSDSGTCAFNPTWQQGSGANEWWIEYQISGSIAAASLEVVGGPTTSLALQWGKWVGGPNAQIPTGTSVVVHATSTSNQTATTRPFGYLVTTAPVTACGGGAPDAGSGDAGAGDAGSDAGGGGTCKLNPTWTQGSGANAWWVEYAIDASATIASASLQVVGGQTVTLSFQWGKWVGLANAAIGTGASVVVHARDTSGNTAQTVPFGYLQTTSPSTQGCP